VKTRAPPIAREHFDLFWRAIGGEGIAERDSNSPFGGGTGLQRIEPQSDGLRSRIWWGAGSRETAEWAGRTGLNLMSSTLITEADGRPFDILQAEQIDRFRAAWREAGHPGTPRVSVSRSVFPITTAEDELYFGHSHEGDGIGYIDGFRSTLQDLRGIARGARRPAAAGRRGHERRHADAHDSEPAGRRLQPAHRRGVREARGPRARLEEHARLSTACRVRAPTAPERDRAP
jgi:alkanesulfonate monooxygenase SsuD/methylene tetrahydromethanopterin reductase-like flavin-dependent oxidoreductase (luciferase family)